MSTEPSLYYDGYGSYDDPKIKFCRIDADIFRVIYTAFIWGIPSRFNQALTLTIFFNSSMFSPTPKKTYTEFQILLKIYLAAMVEIVVE